MLTPMQTTPPQTTLDQICYSRNFLTEVIARLDFAQAVPSLLESMPLELEKVALRAFPIREPQKFIAQSLQISAQGVQQVQGEGLHWHFFGVEREKKLTVLPDALLFVYSFYKSFEVLKEDFLSVTRAFFTTFPEVSGKRLGLRYINNFEFPDRDPFAWDGLINPEMLCLLRLYEDKTKIARAFQNLELAFGDSRLRFQFGMHNPDYPASIRANHFVLDLDGYTEGPQGLVDVENNLLSAHRQIQELFEKSITEEMRGKLNAAT